METFHSALFSVLNPRRHDVLVALHRMFVYMILVAGCKTVLSCVLGAAKGAVRDAVALILDPTQERGHTPLKPGPGETVLSISRGALQRSPTIH